MLGHDLELNQQQSQELDQCLERFLQETGAVAVFLMGRDGQLLSKQCTGDPMPLESVCALTVGAFASSEALASLVGEKTFTSIYHQGIKCNVYAALVGEQHLLLTFFNYRASAPLVRIQARITAEALQGILTHLTS